MEYRDYYKTSFMHDKLEKELFEEELEDDE